VTRLPPTRNDQAKQESDCEGLDRRLARQARQLLKDMLAVQSEIGRFGLDLPLIERAVEQHRAHVAGGNEMADPASIVRLYEDKPTRNPTGRAQ